MTININLKKARIASARQAAAQCKTRTMPVVPASTWYSIWKSRHAILENSDGSHLEGFDRSSHYESRHTTPEPKAPNSIVPDIEILCATRDALQAQVILAVR